MKKEQINLKSLASWHCVVQLMRCKKQEALLQASAQKKISSLKSKPLIKTAARILALSLTGLSSVVAAPQGGVITSGTGNINHVNNITTINQTSETLNADWNSFNVEANETVNFIQPSKSALAVNNILDTNGTTILGNINANGQVWLINPNGVLFGPNATVNVGAILASTLPPENGTTTNGTQVFSGNGKGAVLNQGTINATEGYVAFIANTVSNEGSIIATNSAASNGVVALGAGAQVTVQFAGNALLSLTVNQSTLDNLAENKQLIRADGGMVIMSAGAKDSLLASVVNNEGTIEAKTVQHIDGKIILKGSMKAGAVDVSGTLNASATNADNNGIANGGEIQTSANNLNVDNATVTTSAQNGETGTWIAEAEDFTIATQTQTINGDMSGNAVSNALANNNLYIKSRKGNSGNITLNDPLSWNADNNLSLSAEGNITVNKSISATGSTAKLKLEYGQAAINANNASNYEIATGVKVNLKDGDNFSTKLGSNGTTIQYKVITELGATGSMTGTDLQGINGNLSGDYVLGADINATSTSTWNSGEGFDPLGDVAVKFTGVIDGLGHSINSLTINRPTEDYVGFIGYGTGNNTKIRNLGLDEGSVTGNRYVGQLAGGMAGTIKNVYATGDVTSLTTQVGGLVGRNFANITKSYTAGTVTGVNIVGGFVGRNIGVGDISDVYATGAVNATKHNVGGLIAHNSGSVINSYATGDVTASNTSKNIGGLMGYHYDGVEVSNVYATGDVTGDYQVGGLVGRINGASIADAYATGAVTGDTRVGGLVGINGGGGEISNTYAAGVVTGNTSVSGLVAHQDVDSTTTNSFWNTETTGQVVSASGTAKTTNEMQQLNTFDAAGWSISPLGAAATTWRMYDDTVSPLLRYFMTTLDLSQPQNKTYNGQSQGYLISDGVDQSKVFGLTLAEGINAGTYANDDLQAYSIQQGYDIVKGGQLNINKANATINANGNTLTYDGLLHSVAGYTATGLVNSETVAVLDDVSATGASGTNAGSYTSVVSGTDENYTFNFNNGLLTIDKAPATITLSSDTVTYTGLPQTPSFTVNGLVNGETSTVLGGLSISGGTNAGTYTTVASGLDQNYELNFANTSTLSIQKAVAEVKANSASFTSNGQLHSVAGFKVTGLQNNETKVVLENVTATGVSAIKPGRYENIVSGVDENYDLSFTNGLLTILDNDARDAVPAILDEPIKQQTTHINVSANKVVRPTFLEDLSLVHYNVPIKLNEPIKLNGESSRYLGLAKKINQSVKSKADVLIIRDSVDLIKPTSPTHLIDQRSQDVELEKRFSAK